MEEIESLQELNNSKFDQTPATAMSEKSQQFYAQKRKEYELAQEMKKIKLEMAKEKLAQYKENKANGLLYNGKPMPNRIPTEISTDTVRGQGSISRNLAGDSMYAEYNTGQLSPFASDYFDNKWMGINFGEVTDRHKDKYHGVDPFSGAKDWEHLRREEQGTLAASANLLTQFIGKSAVNTVGGIVGGFYSLGAAAVNADADLLFDNSVNRGIDAASEWVDKNNTVFTSERGRREAPLGIFSIEGTKDISDAYSFITGAVASELLIDTFSGGLGLAGLPGRIASKTASFTAKGMAAASRATGLGKTTRYLGKAVNASEELAKAIRSVDINDIQKVEQAAMNLGMTVQDFQTARKGIDRFNSVVKSGRGIITGTFWEAGLEARGTKDDLIMHETEKLNVFLDSKKAEDPLNWTDEKIATYREEQMAKIREAADTAGLTTFALNTAVLGASNYLQFPTIFGGAKTTSMNSLTGSMKKSALSEYVKTGSRAMNMAKTFGRAMRAPITEFMEETMQGTINTASKSYYESQLGTRSSDGELIPGTAKASDAILKGLEEAYGTSAGRHEGYIGAVVGALGLPMLKRNKAGKLRSVEMTGGIAEAIRDNRQNNIDIEEGMNLMNKADYGTLLSYNKDNAILATIDSKKEELARVNGDKLELERLNDNKVFRYVQERLDKGLGDYVKSDVKEIIDMDLDTYKKKFGKDEEFTQEMKDKEVLAFAGKVDIYSDAYKKVYEGLRMERINNNHVSKKLFDTLTYAVANDKIYGQEQRKLVDQLLKDKDLDMSAEEILELAQLSDKYKHNRKQVDEIIAGRKAEKVANFEKKKADMFAKVDAIKDKIPTEYRALAEEILSGNMDAAEYAKKVIELKDVLKSDEYKDIADTFESLFNSVTEGFEAINIKQELAEEFESKRDKETEIKRPNAIPEVIKKNREGKVILAEAQKEIDKNSSESLNILRGKKDTATMSEINRFIELKKKASDAVAKKAKKPTESILDAIGTDKEKSINEILDELENITKHRTMAVEIAANLYGFDKISNSYAKIANASLVENFDNLRNDMHKGLLEMQTDNDSEDLSVIAESMRMTIEKVEADMKEFEELITPDLKKNLDADLEKARKVRESFLESIELQDVQEEKIIETKKAKKETATNGRINTIDLNEEENEDAEEEVEEEVKGEKVTEDVDNTVINPFNNKNTHTVRVKPKELPANASEGQRKVHENRQEFLRKLEAGEIKYNAASVMEMNDAEADSDDFKQFLEDMGILESFARGAQKVMDDPSEVNKDIEDLDPDVIVFISNYPATLKIYDHEVKLDEGIQKFTIREDDMPTFELIQFAPSIDVNPRAADIFNKKKDELYKAYVKKQIDIKENEEFSEEEKTKQLGILKTKYQAQYEDLKAEFQSTEISANDRALFAMRQALVINRNNTPEDSDKPANELKMRLGGIIEGPFEKAGDLSVEVEEYGLTGEGNNDNYLIESIADIDFSMFMFGKQDGTYVDFNDKEMVGPNALNRGSLNPKKNAMTGRAYLKFKTVNGRTVPIMLNMGTLQNSEILVDEMMHQMNEFLKEKNKLGIVKIKNPELSFLAEKTFDQFFQSILGRNKSTTGFDIGDSTLNIDAKGNIRLGRMDMVLDRPELFEDEDIKASIQLAIQGSRFFFNSKQMRNPDGSMNEKFLRFIVSNKLINHAFNASKNNDKVFLKESFTGEPYHKSAQFHVLNEEIDSTIKGKEKPKVKTLKQNLRDLFGKRKGASDKSKLTWESAFNTLNYEVAKAFEKGIAAGLDNQTSFDNAVTEVVQGKLDLVISMANDFPTQYTKGLVESLQNEDKIMVKAEDKIVDKYVKLLVKYHSKIRNNPQAMSAFLEMNNSKDYDIRFKKMMLNASPVKMMTHEAFEDEFNDKGTIKSVARMKFKMGSALTGGTPEQNKRKVKNLIKALDLLNQTGDLGMSINKKHFNTPGIEQKAGGGVVYLNHVKTYAYINKKSKKVESAVAKHNDYKVDSKGNTIKGSKQVNEKDFDYLSYKYWYEGKLQGSNPVIYKYTDSEGKLVVTEEPGLDFVFNEDGTLQNGAIYLVTVNDNGKNGQRQEKLLLAGTETDPKTHQYISTISIPGLDQDYEIDEANYDQIQDLSMEFSKGWGDVNKIVDNSVKTGAITGDIKLTAKEDIEDNDSDDEVDEALKSIMSGVKKKNTGNVSKSTNQDKKTAKSILDDALRGMPGKDINEDEFGPDEDQDESDVPDTEDMQDLDYFLSEDEDEDEDTEDDKEEFSITNLPPKTTSKKGTTNFSKIDINAVEDKDELFRQAADVVVQQGIGSANDIVRFLKVGYNRAGRLLDQLEQAGIVEPFTGEKGRKVNVANMDDLNKIFDTKPSNISTSKTSSTTQSISEDDKMTLKANNRRLIKDMKGSIIPRTNFIKDTYNQGGLTKLEAINHFNDIMREYGVNTYADMIEAIKIIHDNKVASFEEMAKFVSEIHGKKYKPEDNNC